MVEMKRIHILASYLHGADAPDRDVVPVPADCKVSRGSLFFLEIILFFLIWIIELLVTSPSHEKLTRSPSVLFWFSGGLVITAPPENKLTSIRVHHQPPVE